MSITELKKSLHDLIEHADERLLRMVHSLASEYTKYDDEIVAHRAGKSITKDELYQELKEAETEIKNGHYSTLEDFDKESEQWD